MTRLLYGFVLLILCASLAFSGTKVSNRATTIDRPASEKYSGPPDAGKDLPLPPAPWRSSTTAGVYTGIGGYWDYQSNGGHVDHIQVDSVNGYIHTIMMIALDSADVLGNAATRRTQYTRSTNDGVAWDTPKLVPTGRSGYPALALLRGPVERGAPLVTSHSGADNTQTWVYTRPLADPPSGEFAEVGDVPDVFPPPAGGQPIWPKVTSGANGEINVFGTSNDTTGTYQSYVTRTSDYGTTWREPWFVWPLIGLSGGQYTMRNDGANKIGLLGGGSLGWVGGQDTLSLWESTDNGASWPATATTVFGPGVYFEGDSLVPRQGTLDLIYRNGEPYVAITMMRNDLLYSTCRIMLWNPTLGWKAAVKPDSLQFTTTFVSQAGHLPVCFPSMGLSGSSIVMVFEGYPGGEQYQDTLASGRYKGEIFITQSLDGGNTWTLPVNLTNTPGMDDKFPSLAKWNPAGYAYLVWQEDPNAGAAARNDGEGPVAYASQKFMKIDLNTVFPTNDITTLQVTAPTPSNAIREGVGFTPKAAFRNIGLLTQTNIPVTFQILDGSNTVLFTDNQTIPSLASTVTTEVTFASVPGSLLTYGKYTTRAFCANPGDSHATNDSTRSSVQIIPVVAVTGTYTEDFEGAAESGGFGWFGAIIGSSSTSDWVRGTPAKTQISGAHSGTKCYVTKLTGEYSNAQESFLGSPVFDFSSVTGNVRMEFYQNYIFEPLWDGGWLQYSTDGGVTWHVADSTLASGPGWTTGMSSGWYNANVDSQVVAGAPAPPFWSDSTVLNASHVNGWIKSTTILPVGGYSDVRLRFYMSADALTSYEGWAIDDIVLKTGAGTANVPLVAGWNMISNPVQKPAGQDSVQTIYPTSALPHVFGFGSSGYYQTRIMANGPGYWGKFNTAGSQAISGSALQSLSAPVNQGWNMIGSMTTSVDTANVYPSPYGSRASVYFGYSAGYAPVATLDPGMAYWVKTSAAGAFLYLPPAAGAPAGKVAVSPLASLNTLTVKDAAGHSTTLYFGGVEEGQLNASLYEMPPVPPAGAFDARFETAEAGYLVQTHEKGALTGEFPVAIQSAVYPLTLSWNVVSDAGYQLRDGMGSKAFAARELRGTGSFTVRNSAVNRLVLGIGGDALPKEYALMQNYPNPFNPSTTIKFALPEPSRVTVEIYNLLGQRVSTLLSDQLTAGYHEVQWNGTTSAGQLVGSGIYFARFSANGADGKSFSDVRKLMLMK